MRNGYYNFSIETIEEVVRLLGTVFIRNIGTSYYRETLKLVTAIAHLSWENFTERLVWRVEISIYLQNKQDVQQILRIFSGALGKIRFNRACPPSLVREILEAGNSFQLYREVLNMASVFCLFSGSDFQDTQFLIIKSCLLKALQYGLPIPDLYDIGIILKRFLKEGEPVSEVIDRIKGSLKQGVPSKRSLQELQYLVADILPYAANTDLVSLQQLAHSCHELAKQ